MSSIVAHLSACIDRRCFSKFEDKASMLKRPVRVSVVSSYHKADNKSIKVGIIGAGRYHASEDKANMLKRPVRVSVVSSYHKADNKSIKVGIIGAGRYHASELIGFIANHPSFVISLMTDTEAAGRSIESVFPHLIMQDLPDLVAVNDANFSSVDAVFCCLPHDTSQEIIKGLPNKLKIVDLSGGFRLRDVNDYVKWYGEPHKAVELQQEAVYGLTEIHRKKIESARLVANPGYYPSAILLSLVPLIKANLIVPHDDIIIFSDSEVCEAELPEIEQELSDAANSKVAVNYSSFGMSLQDDMLLVINVQMAPGASVEDLKQHLEGFYEKEEFVVLLRDDEVKDVKGSNGCRLWVVPDNIPGRARIIPVVDKLVKGPPGQALQNLNLMMGIPENTGLRCLP